MKTPIRVLLAMGAEVDTLPIAEELQRGGYAPTFQRAGTQAELAKALEANRRDLVIADHRPPDLTAYEVMEQLRARKLDLPVIVVADSLGEQNIVSLMKAGVHNCLSRVNLHALHHCVGAELREADSRRARRRAQQRDDDAEQTYRRAVEGIPALNYVAWADAIGSRVWVGPQIDAMAGFSGTEWVAEPECWARQLHPDDRERVLAEYRKSWTTNSPFVSEYRIRHRDGRVMWWRDEGQSLLDEEGQPQLVRGFVLDVTERKQAEESVRHMKYHDPLTGLPNRVLFRERGVQALDEARASGAPVALMIVSLDRFREINNTLGHGNGDKIIAEVARRLGELVGASERVARLGGDEFAVIVPGADARLALMVGRELLKILEHPVMVEKLPIEVGCSVGISVRPEHGHDFPVLLRRADQAVAVAKREHSGCVVYSPEHDPYDPRKLALLGELRRGIEAGELLLHYQPKVDLERGCVVGAEALVRWQHPKLGLVSPDQFVPLAERGGLIKPLTTWVLDEAVTECVRWRQAGHPLPVAVNLSARSLGDSRLLEQIRGLLEAKGLASDLLCLELTESAVMDDPVRAGEILSGLQASGVGLAIDDFGTGYSCLAYLGNLPVSELKIDKSFVIGMASPGEESATIVRSTNDLGHNLGLTVVAEGVEDQQTLDVLGSFGCDEAQGFYIGRPMNAAAFRGWVKDSAWSPPGH